MRALAIIAAALWMAVDCNVHAGEIMTACRPLAEPIHLAATEHRVPVLLLTALVFAESSCDPSVVNAKGATGLGQILTTGAGEGYTQAELMDPWTNLQIASKHLAKWKRRCGTWRGAVGIYHGCGKCSAKSRYADWVIRSWRQLEKESEPRV